MFSLGMSIFLAFVLGGSSCASGFAGSNFGLDDVVRVAAGDLSSCLSAKDAETCRSLVEEGTGDPCVWCTCSAVPSECLGSSLAKVRAARFCSCVCRLLGLLH